jgi:hypothetical protein
VVVGADERGEALIRSLAAQRDSDVRVLGVFDDRSEERTLPNIRQKLGTVDDLVEFARRTVIFALPVSAENRILQMLKKLWVLPVDIRLAAHSNKLRFRPRAYSYIGSVPVLDVLDKPITDWDVVMKWLFDKIVGSVILLLAAPLMLVTALAIKLDSPRAGAVPAEALRVQQRADRSLQVPLDVCGAVRPHGHEAGAKGGFARHQSGRLYPQDFDRRAAAALQRGFQRQPVTGRAAPPRYSCQGRESTLRRGGGRLFRPPSREARHHRVGADQRLARRDRHAGKDPAPGRARSLLHRELVRAVRSFHPGEDTVRAGQDRERVPMSVAISASVTGPRLAAESLRGALLWLVGFAGAFVFVEPSPYELVAIVTMLLFAITGLSLRAALAPMALMLILMNIGHAIAVVPVSEDSKAVSWVLISVFLTLTAVFYAAMLGDNAERRLELLMRGYLAAAIIASVVPVAGYFRMFGAASEMFIEYGRARGTFNDPNVLGAFLILPALLLYQRVLAGRRVVRSAMALLVILAALFLTFSRGAWGQVAFAGMVLMAVTFVTRRSNNERLRIIAIAAASSRLRSC